MPNEKSDFDAAMKKLAAEVRKGVAKVHPMTAEQKRAIEAALESPVARKSKREEKSQPLLSKKPSAEPRRRRDRGHDFGH
jgi:hypothetical protein